MRTRPIAPPKGEKSKKQPSEVTEMFTLYGELFNKYVGEKPHISHAKDGAIFKRILRERGLDETKKLLELYFQTANDFVTGRGYPVELFAKDINALLTKGGIKKEYGDPSHIPFKEKERLKDLQLKRWRVNACRLSIRNCTTLRGYPAS